MPALVVLGQRTALADDDLRISCIMAILLRVLQLGLTIALIVFLSQLNLAHLSRCVYSRPMSLAQHGRALMISYSALSLFLVVAALPIELIM